MNSKYNKVNLSDVQSLLGFNEVTNRLDEINLSTSNADELLDQYNDYRLLHTMFGDYDYKLNADASIARLKGLH